MIVITTNSKIGSTDEITQGLSKRWLNGTYDRLFCTFEVVGVPDVLDKTIVHLNRFLHDLQ
jgi:hypothetical protein